jgi:lipopolysaccharide export system permease protein
MMRLLDRYVTGLFASALVIFTAAFLALFVTVDFAPNLTRFLDLKSIPILRFIAWYYAIRVPLFIALVMPIVVLFAAIFTVIKLQRTNEVLPIAASGTSLRRMSFPFLVAAVLSAAGMAAIDEFALPALAPELARTEEIKNSKEWSYGVADYIETAWIWGRSYNHVKQEMGQDIRIMILGADHRPAVQVRARRCGWDHARRRWVAFDGKVEYWSEKEFIYREGERPRPRIDDIPASGYVVEAPFKVEALRTSASSGDRYAYAPLRELIEAARLRPDLPVWRVRIHHRFAFPLSPLVLLLMGLPSVVAAHSKSFVRGLMISALYVALYYPVHFFMMDLGNHGAAPPAVAGWFATGLFGAIGVASFLRMRT